MSKSIIFAACAPFLFGVSLTAAESVPDFKTRDVSTGGGKQELTQPMLDDGAAARAYSVQVLTRLADPVLNALCENKLKERLPKGKPDRQQFAPLEALGRLMAGLAPWLELGPGEDAEGKLRAHYIGLAVQGIGNAVDPHGPDFMCYKGGQPQVDTAFLALGLLRAPKQLWGNLGAKERTNLVAALKEGAKNTPGENNWVLFSATIEAALWQFTGECDMMPIERGVNKYLGWYLGDGVYGDGPEFHADYYNSYVIHPMFLEVLRVCADKQHEFGKSYPLVLKRAQRFAQIQERLISPEATFPVVGRSSTYRFGAFQTLAEIALLKKLPANLEPGQVRAALTAVIRRTIEAPGTFDEAGWLQPGAVGYQPSIREGYISPGSPYLCSMGLIELGLPANDPFWSGPDLPWTQKKIWSGVDVKADAHVPY
jgi:hypothetical protein